MYLRPWIVTYGREPDVVRYIGMMCNIRIFGITVVTLRGDTWISRVKVERIWEMHESCDI